VEKKKEEKETKWGEILMRGDDHTMPMPCHGLIPCNLGPEPLLQGRAQPPLLALRGLSIFPMLSFLATITLFHNNIKLIRSHVRAK
jgi:hypothetical protein